MRAVGLEVSSLISRPFFLILLPALALTGAFLAGPARARMDAWTAGVMLLHLGLGILLAPMFLVGAIKAVASSQWPIASTGKGIRATLTLSVSALATGYWLLATAFLSGTALIVAAARGGTAPDAVLDVHVAAGFAAVAVAWAILIRRRESSAADRQIDPRESSTGGVADRGSRGGAREPGADLAATPPSLEGAQICGRSPLTLNPVASPRAHLTPLACAMLVTLVLAGLLAGSAAVAPGDASGVHYQPNEYYANLTATNVRQAKNPLFPAGTTVVVEPGARVRLSPDCGAAGCHPDAYREWLGSAHQRAAVDPAYRQAAGLFEAQRGPSARRWCEGCHGPVAMATQVLGIQVFRRSGVQGEDASSGRSSNLNTRTPEHLNTALQPEGVNCLTCHATTRVTELSGNGRFELRVPAEYPFAEDPNPRLRWLHGFLLRLRPGPHRLAFMKPAPGTPGGWMRQSEFCASCHRMSYNLPQNGYKFLRTEDEYGTWQAGPDSGQPIHDFYPLGPVRQCQDCHSPHAGGVQAFRRSGVQVGGTCALPGLLNARTPERLNAPPVIVDLLALRRPPRMPGAPEELVAPLDREIPLLQRGEMLTVDVVIRNLRVGHEFPAGIGNGSEAWLEFDVLDSAGPMLLCSGKPGPHGEIDAGAHAYGLIGLDRQGHQLVRDDLWNMVTPLYHRPILPGQPDADRRTIQPGESDVARYRIRIPVSAVGPLQLQARLWCWRSGVRGQGSGVSPTRAATLEPLRPAGTDNWRQATGDFLMAEDSVTLPLAAKGNSTGMAQPVSARLSSLIPHPSSLTSSPHPPQPARFYDYGVGLLLQGDLPRAMRAMQRVQAWAPRDAQGYLGLGRVYLTEGDLLAARAQFEKAGRLAPHDPRPLAFLAATERKMGQYEAALALLRPLVRAYPRDRLLWFDVGMCHYLSGRYEEASRAFLRMLDIDPEDLAAHYNLMRSLRRLRRVSEARREEVIYQTLREDDNAKQIALAYLRTHPLADRETRTVHEHPLRSVTSDE